ncbi:MAG TPA: hypothetical protein IAA20_09950 [Candidatus Enterococcus avicola]|uniref:Uncharacterized protein n=1 Tax=Candidatus Enterococcus avicola TaxID=2838561 RepID=A0A9D2JIS5_9ENTE|nr:hypothetical protein [Candidatus Enterococcus avicola]
MKLKVTNWIMIVAIAIGIVGYFWLKDLGSSTLLMISLFLVVTTVRIIEMIIIKAK